MRTTPSRSTNAAVTTTWAITSSTGGLPADDDPDGRDQRLMDEISARPLARVVWSDEPLDDD